MAGDKERLVRILLHGLTGPIGGKAYNNVMAPFGAADKGEWVAAVLSFARYNFVRENNRRFGPAVTADEVKKISTETSGRKKLWTWEELEDAAKNNAKTGWKKIMF